jgi:hypothetical protein
MLVVPEKCVRWLQAQRPQGDYQKEIELDFLMIEPYLPEKVDSIIDIGCGMAGIDVFLKRKFPNARLELLDGDGEQTNYGFSKVCKPYNSRECTTEFLAANGVKCDRWHEAYTKEHLKADLVISLLSWGFHYPLGMYKVSGFCIADLRKSHEEVRGKVISEATKYHRCAFTC